MAGRLPRNLFPSLSGHPARRSCLQLRRVQSHPVNYMPLPLKRAIDPDALRIIEAFPGVFGRPPLNPSHSSLVRGFLCGPGWYSILEDLAAKLERVVRDDHFARFVVWHVAEHGGVLQIRYDRGNDRVKASVDAAERASLLICEDCGVPSRHQARDGWGTTLCDACHASYLHSVTDSLAGGDDRPARIREFPTQPNDLSGSALQSRNLPKRTTRWSCDMCHAGVDRGTDMGGSWIDRHCVRARDGSLIGIFAADGYWTSGNGEALCGECVDALIGYLIQPPAGMVYDPRRNRSVSAEGVT